ncbi:MAG: ATPase, T2SS/T4P/T4SS family [Pirellulaceae bacterium]
MSKRNIIIDSGTGSGKTTLLNCLSEYIPDRERIVTIEDTAELQLKNSHVVSMKTKRANAEGKGEYTIQALVRNALRMRPDRIVVGEDTEGPKRLDMLRSPMNTGHDGSMTTLHANSPEDVPLRLEVLVGMAADLPVESIHRQISSAVDLIVQLQRIGRRRVVSHVTEVVDFDPIRRRVRLKELFRIRPNRQDSLAVPTGYLPSYIHELQDQNLLDLSVFFAN